MIKKGKFIVIEGSDGSGKGTQSQLLIDWLRTGEYDFETFDFPQYGQPSAYFVEQYLNGQYGEIPENGPYRTSIFYAVDRFAASFKLRKLLNDGVHVVSNRYVASNMGHQGAKIDSPEERSAYFSWNDKLEYDIFEIPRPDLNIVLHMPSVQAQKFIDQKASRAYVNGKKRDLHEADLGHLERAEQTYLQLCEQFPDSFKLIQCQAGDGSIRPIEDIQANIRKLVGQLIKGEPHEAIS